MRERALWASELGPRYVLAYAIIVLLTILVIGALAAIYGASMTTGLQYACVASLGALVGATELMQHYREEPIAVMRTPGAVVYILVNALASCFALFLFQLVPAWRMDEFNSVALGQTFMAGLAGMALLRTAIFKARIGDKEVGVGPAIILDVILIIADRDADRRMALTRLEFATPLMRNIDFDRAFDSMKRLCLGLMQNLTSIEQGLIEQRVDALKDIKEADPEVRSTLLALLLSTFVGRDLVRGVVRMHGERWVHAKALAAQMTEEVAAARGRP